MKKEREENKINKQKNNLTQKVFNEFYFILFFVLKSVV